MVVVRQFLKKWLKFIILCFLLIVIFSYAMFQGGFVSWFLFYSFLPFALYSVSLFIYSISDFAIDRQVSQVELLAGDTLRIRISITRKNQFPLFFLAVEEVLPPTITRLYPTLNVSRLLFPGFKKTMSLTYEIPAVPRGEHILSEIRLKTGDLLGLIEKQVVLPVYKSVLVYPKPVPITFQLIESDFEQGRNSSAVKLNRESAIVSGIRDYEPGDRMHAIDWKSTAKRSTLMTKQFEENRSKDLFLLLDCQAPSYLFEEMVVFAASITESVMKKGTRLGLLAVDSSHHFLPVKEGEAHRKQLFLHFAKVEAMAEHSLNTILPLERASIPIHASLIIITSMVSIDLVKSALSLTDKSRGMNIICFRLENGPLTTVESEAKTYGLSRGIKINFIQGRNQWDYFGGDNR